MIKEEITNIQYNYKTRMVDELIGLIERIALLEKALSVEISEITALNKEKNELMHKQLDCMYGYRSALMDRIYMELQ